MKTSNSLLAVVVVLSAVLAVWAHSYFRRQSDWDEVLKIAIRVDSGLKHESLIALRSKVADLDAALTHYVDDSGTRQKENRVRSIRQSIESLEWAIDHENASAIVDRSEGFTFYERRPYLLAEPNCYEASGKLFLGSSDLAKASLTYAQSALTRPEQSTPLRAIDLGALRAKCSTRYQAYTNEKAAIFAAKQEESKRTRAPRTMAHACECKNNRAQHCDAQVFVRWRVAERSYP
jgi:hypothetical protein